MNQSRPLPTKNVNFLTNFHLDNMIVYRIEHIDSKLGPFQHGMSAKTRALLMEYWDGMANINLKFPPPTEDSLILENKNIPQNLKYKFACVSEEAIYEWLSEKVVNRLRKEGFEIRKYVKDVDFQHIIMGTNQVVVFIEP